MGSTAQVERQARQEAHAENGSRNVPRTRVVFGPGATAALPELVQELVDEGRATMPVLLVFGATSASRPWRRRVTRELAGLRPDVVEHARRYPTEESVAAVADAVRACGTGIVVAVGGGSVLDAAKVARARLAEERGDGSPALVAVPTTPGTGAEVTPFATVWDFERPQKDSVASPEVRPTAAVVDPELTTTMDRREYGSSALDALVQGVEAAWSTRSTAESIALGLTATGLAREAYEAAVEEPGNLGARTAVSLAGLHSGRAIAVSQTTACHAISYPLTLRAGVRHGHACSLPLGAVLAYNARPGDCADPRGPEHVRDVVRRILRALGAREPRQVNAVLARFRRLAGLEEWSEVAVDAASVAAQAVTYGRLSNNPRRLSGEQLLALLEDRRTR